MNSVCVCVCCVRVRACLRVCEVVAVVVDVEKWADGQSTRESNWEGYAPTDVPSFWLCTKRGGAAKQGNIEVICCDADQGTWYDRGPLEGVLFRDKRSTFC